MNDECKHCGKKPGTKARGLCEPCYTNLDIRKLYPVKIPGKGCIECRKRAAKHYARGVCKTCYTRLFMYGKYVRGAKKTARRETDFYGTLPLGEPTDIPAGPLRLAIYAERVAKNLSIFHPGDTLQMSEVRKHVQPSNFDFENKCPRNALSVRW